MDALVTARVFDVRNTPLTAMPRDASVTTERILRIGQGPKAPAVAAFQASI